MRRGDIILGFLTVGLLVAGADNAATGPDVRTETIWRGAFRGESLFVRAKWMPIPFSASCVAAGGGNFDDTTFAQRKYLAYRLENTRGRVLSRESVSGDQFFCCDGLQAEGTGWAKGIVVTVSASGRGCEPAGDCEEHRYLYVSSHSSVARSDWTWFPWDPASEAPFGGTVREGCIEYPMTLEAHVVGDRIDFLPTLPPGTKEGDLQELPLIDELSAYCPRPSGPPKPVTIELFPTTGSTAAKPLLIRDTDKIEIRSAVVRVERTPSGALTTSLFLLGIRALGQQGFVTPAALKSVGFLGF